VIKRNSIILSASLAGFLLVFAFSSIGHAELSLEEVKKLLQEGLTISEIDRELERLSGEEVLMNEQIIVTESEIISTDSKVKQTREHAGRVLRSYYMGERNNLWLLLLRANSFADALSVYQYLQVIAESDQHALDVHTTAFHELKQLRSTLIDKQADLVAVKQAFTQQRERLVKLQAELDKKLAEQANKDVLLAQIEQLNKEWRTDGLPLFREFLQAMTEAMSNLTGYLTENEDAIEPINRNTLLFQIEQDSLNRFLRQENPIFDHFAYTITDQHIVINGSQDQVKITVKGHYEIEHEPEEALRFMLDELTFNDFVLPDTTRLEMQQQFKMTFYPEQHTLTAVMKFASVKLAQGQFTVEIKLP
jgi:hypothetical protein